MAKNFVFDSSFDTTSSIFLLNKRNFHHHINFLRQTVWCFFYKFHFNKPNFSPWYSFNPSLTRKEETVLCRIHQRHIKFTYSFFILTLHPLLSYIVDTAPVITNHLFTRQFFNNLRNWFRFLANIHHVIKSTLELPPYQPFPVSLPQWSSHRSVRNKKTVVRLKNK